MYNRSTEFWKSPWRPWKGQTSHQSCIFKHYYRKTQTRLGLTIETRQSLASSDTLQLYLYTQQEFIHLPNPADIDIELKQKRIRSSENWRKHWQNSAIIIEKEVGHQLISRKQLKASTGIRQIEFGHKETWKKQWWQNSTRIRQRNLTTSQLHGYSDKIQQTLHEQNAVVEKLRANSNKLQDELEKEMGYHPTSTKFWKILVPNSHLKAINERLKTDLDNA